MSISQDFSHQAITVPFDDYYEPFLTERRFVVGTICWFLIKGKVLNPQTRLCLTVSYDFTAYKSQSLTFSKNAVYVSPKDLSHGTTYIGFSIVCHLEGVLIEESLQKTG